MFVLSGDTIRASFDRAIDSDAGAAPPRPVRKKKTQNERIATDLFHGGGFGVESGGRPSRYTVAPLDEAFRQEHRSHGLVREVFYLAARTTTTDDMPNARWQRDCIYELVQAIRSSSRTVRELDRLLGNKGSRHRDLLGLPSSERVDGRYRIVCPWCGRLFTAKRRVTFLHSSACRQAWRRAGFQGTDWVLNQGRLYDKVEGDRELLGAIRSIAFYSLSPRCEV